ncbi:MAG TPA: hypothetical protein VE219_05565, partial [Candidatus Sulfotelmatobacter sp.]|nr:hypothetical protein [Candidatus Sulfotelmatobacter sp.]
MGEALITCALGPDNVGPLLRTFVDETRANLDAAVYEVGPYYTWLFRRAARAGVHTRLVLDGHPGANTTCTRILAHGPVACRVLRSTKFAAHWKLLTADGHRVAVGTGNLIKRNAPRPYSCRGRALSTVPAAGAICPQPVCPVTWLAQAPPPPGLAGTREWWALISGAPRLAGAAMRHFEQAWHQAVAPVPMWEMRWVTGVPAVAAPRPAVPALVMRVDEGCLGLTVGGDAVRRLLKERLRESRRTALVTVPY